MIDNSNSRLASKYFLNYWGYWKQPISHSYNSEKTYGAHAAFLQG